jgi:hypothetical protein
MDQRSMTGAFDESSWSMTTAHDRAQALEGTGSSQIDSVNPATLSMIWKELLLLSVVLIGGAYVVAYLSGHL